MYTIWAEERKNRYPPCKKGSDLLHCGYLHFRNDNADASHVLLPKSIALAEAIYRTYRQVSGMETGKVAGVHNGKNDEIPHDRPCFW